MTGKITKIDQPRFSRNGGFYQRIYFELEDGSWAATDLVSTYRNFARWKPVLEAGVGIMVCGLDLVRKSKVDADSQVKIFQEKLI